MALFGIPLSAAENATNNVLPGVINGTGPSAARGQLNEGLGQVERNAISIARSDRSNPNLAMRNALLANNDAAVRTNQQAATLRAQEQLNAMGLGAQQGNVATQQLLGQIGAIGQGIAGAGGGTPNGDVAGAAGALKPGMDKTAGAGMMDPQAAIAAKQQMFAANQQALGQAPQQSPASAAAPQIAQMAGNAATAAMPPQGSVESAPQLSQPPAQLAYNQHPAAPPASFQLQQGPLSAPSYQAPQAPPMSTIPSLPGLQIKPQNTEHVYQDWRQKLLAMNGGQQ